MSEKNVRNPFGDEAPADFVDSLCAQYGMTRKQLFFAAHYVATLNGRKAAILAGYSEDSAASTASFLLKQSHVNGYINDCFLKITMQPAEILTRLTAIARGDIGDYLKVVKAKSSDIPLSVNGEIIHGIYVDIRRALDDDNTAVIKSFRRIKGETAIELHDPTRAMELLGKHYRMWIDRVENNDVSKRNVDDMSDQELAEIAGISIDALQARARQNATSGGAGVLSDAASDATNDDSGADHSATPETPNGPPAPRTTAFTPTGDTQRDVAEITKRLTLYAALAGALSDEGNAEYRRLQQLYAELTGGTFAAGNPNGDVFGENDDD